MVELRFTDEMRKALSSMKGKTFKSYQGAPLHVDGYVLFFGSVRINLGKSALDVTNHLETVPFFEDKDDLSCFKCTPVDKGSDFDQCITGPLMEFMVDERIKSVNIVTDKISVQNSSYEIELDTALVIQTEGGFYTFTRDWYFEENITANYDKKKPIVYDVDKVKEDWENCGENIVTIERRTEEL